MIVIYIVVVGTVVLGHYVNMGGDRTLYYKTLCCTTCIVIFIGFNFSFTHRDVICFGFRTRAITDPLDNELIYIVGVLIPHHHKYLHV